jgi:hypothetical protein
MIECSSFSIEYWQELCMECRKVQTAFHTTTRQTPYHSRSPLSITTFSAISSLNPVCVSLLTTGLSRARSLCRSGILVGFVGDRTQIEVEHRCETVAFRGAELDEILWLALLAESISIGDDSLIIGG